MIASSNSGSSRRCSGPRIPPRLLLCFAPGAPFTSTTTFRTMSDILGRRFRTSEGDIKALLSDSDRFELIIISSGHQSLSSKDCEILIAALDDGGKLLILLDERMDDAVISSYNFFLESFNISVRYIHFASVASVRRISTV